MSKPMNLTLRISVAALSTVLGAAAQTGSPCIALYENVPTPLRHAVHRLSEHTGFPLDQALSKERCVRVELNSAQNPRIGTQGYTIASANQGDITIRGNEAEGTANASTPCCGRWMCCN